MTADRAKRWGGRPGSVGNPRAGTIHRPKPATVGGIVVERAAGPLSNTGTVYVRPDGRRCVVVFLSASGFLVDGDVKPRRDSRGWLSVGYLPEDGTPDTPEYWQGQQRAGKLEFVHPETLAPEAEYLAGRARAAAGAGR